MKKLLSITSAFVLVLAPFVGTVSIQVAQASVSGNYVVNGDPAVCSPIGAVIGTSTDSAPFCTIQQAVDVAHPGETIFIVGTQVVTSTIAVNIPLTFTSSGTTEIDTTGGNYVFSINAGGASTTIHDLTFKKTDTVSDDAMILLDGNNVTIASNTFEGQFNIGDGETSRAFDIANGITGFDIKNNTFSHLRQPAYINNATGTIENNFTQDTKGWVVVSESNTTFAGNTWGTGSDINYEDIAVISDSPIGSDHYANILGVSAANNNAEVEDQMPTPHVLTTVYVNAAAATGGDGTPTKPYQTISLAIPRVVAGGTIKVANGAYSEAVNIEKTLTLMGESEAGVVVTQSAQTPYGHGITVTAAPNVTIENMTFDTPAGSPGAYALHAYQDSGLTLSNLTFNGPGATGKNSGGHGIGGVDINSVNGVNIQNVNANDYSKNGFSFTAQNAATDTATNNVVLNNIVSNGNAWNGIAFYNTTNSGLIGANMTGVTFTGHNSISNNLAAGIFFEGDTDAHFASDTTPAYNVTGVGTSTLDISAVAFSGNSGYDVVNYETDPVNALGATFDPGAITGSVMTAAQRSTEDGKIFDKLDNSALGLVTYYVKDTTPPVVTVKPVAGSVLSGIENFTITVTDNNPLDPTKNAKVWVYLYNATGTQKEQGANVNLSSGTGIFTVDTTKLNNGDSWLDVGQVFDAAGNPSGSGDNYFKNYDIENTTTTATSTSTTSTYVHIIKYLDGTLATTANASGTVFPMVSTWTAANLNGGVQSSGAYDLGPSDSYQAVTSPMNVGADYTTQEVTTGSVVGSSCSAGDPFALAGYSTGTSFALAASSTVSTTVPSFSGLTGDEYVVVWNRSCLPPPIAPTLVSPADGATVKGASVTQTWSDSDPTIDHFIYKSFNNASATSLRWQQTFSSSTFSKTATNVATTTYWWNVEAVNAAGDTSVSPLWKLNVSNTPIYVTTKAATNLASYDAILNGVNVDDNATGHSFWVSTSSFSTANPTNPPSGVYSTPDFGAIAASTTFSAPLSLLTTQGVAQYGFPGDLPAITPNTTYYYVAWSDVGGTWHPGALMSFTTVPAPYVTTGSSTNVTSYSATVNGTNGPSNADDTSFWWGTTAAGPFAAGGNTTEFPAGWKHDAGLGAAAAGGSFNESLTNLVPNTTYYYVAWSQIGGVWQPGAVLTFTTPALGTDDSLSGLGVSAGVLSPSFNPAVTSYTDLLPYSTTLIPTVTATTTDAGATSTISQASSTTGTATVAVTSQNGSSTKNYTVNFSLGTASTSILNVALSVSGGTATSSDFTVGVLAGHPSISSFPGNPAGTAVTIDPNVAYNVNVSSSVSNYTQATIGVCNAPSGIPAGTSANCVITEIYNTPPPLSTFSVIVGSGQQTPPQGQVLGASIGGIQALQEQIAALQQQLLALLQQLLAKLHSQEGGH